MGDAPQQANPASEFERLRQVAAPYVVQVKGRGW